MAAHLRTLGVGPDHLVVLYMEHSIEVVCAILGVLKAGAAYVPVDPAHPERAPRLHVAGYYGRTCRHSAGVGDPVEFAERSSE